MIPIKRANQIEKTNEFVLGSENDILKEELKTSKEDTCINYDEIMEDINKFSSSKTVKSINNKLKMAKKINKFNSKMKNILIKVNNVFQTDDKIQEIFKFVLQASEDYLYFSDLTKDESYNLKYEISDKLLKQFINDDNIRKEFIKMSMKNIKPATFYRRNKKQIQRVFFLLFQTLVRAI